MKRARYKASDDFVLQQQAMAEEIDAILEAYRQDESTYKYFHGFPYQGVGSHTGLHFTGMNR